MQNAKFNRKVLDSGKTLYRICKETGIPYTTLSELATGKKAINNIAAETVYKLCVYFVCDVKDILNDVNCGNNVSGNYRGYRYLWKNEDSGPSLYISKGDVIVETKTYEQIYAKRPIQIMISYAELLINDCIQREEEEVLVKEYILMHKDDNCGVLIIDEETGRFVDYKDLNAGISPFLGNADAKKIKRWWELRAVSANRDTIRALINSFDITTNEDYLAKNLALSVTDAYWIKPFDIDIKYEDINFYKFQKYNNGKVSYHNDTSYSPDASLGGQMEKYWDLSGSVPVLVKQAYKSFGQQAVNEKLATIIHNQQNPDVTYTQYDIKRMEDGSVYSMCEAFTNQNIEYISAYEVMESEKTPNDINDYESYIRLCVKNGLDDEAVRRFMDYQTLTDFVISNTDEHLMNFGVLRDSDTLSLIGTAPIFDSGNSMFYDDLKAKAFTREELLQRKVTSFYKSEEKILKNVKFKNIVTFDLLPSPHEVAEFYKENGIPENRAELIAENYGNKLILLHEFQHGKEISMYHESKNPVQYQYDDWYKENLC